MRRPRRLTAAFSLVEILIVTAALAIVAAVVLPQFSRASSNARLSELTTTLQAVRGQLALYKLQHDGRYPMLAQCAEQMTLYTDPSGASSPTRTIRYHLGPYLTVIPVNPFTGASTVSDGRIGSAAWYYDERSGEFRANDSLEHAQY